MTELPDVISAYFAAAASEDVNAMVATMTPDVVVVDDGATWEGSAGVRAWKAKVDHEFEFTTELVGVEATGPAAYVVTGHVVGNFPGGEVTLYYSFALVDGLIDRLQISPRR